MHIPHHALNVIDLTSNSSSVTHASSFYSSSFLAKGAALLFFTIATNSTGVAEERGTESLEKCYGIAKAGMNDCKTATASCAGSATHDKQKDAFLFLLKGTCTKIVGGRLSAEANDPSKKDL